MEIIGLDKIERIIAAFTNYTRNSLIYNLKLSPNQRLFSTGIDYEKLKQYLKETASDYK